MTVKYVGQLSHDELLDIHKKCVDSTAIKVENIRPWKYNGNKIANLLVFVTSKVSPNEDRAKGYVFHDFYAPHLPDEDCSFHTAIQMAYRILMTRRFGLPYALDLLEETTYVSRDDIKMAYTVNNEELKPIDLKTILTRGKK